jgi:WD40 repeat protein
MSNLRRRKRQTEGPNSSLPAILIGVLLTVGALAAGVWFVKHKHSENLPEPVADSAPEQTTSGHFSTHRDEKRNIDPRAQIDPSPKKKAHSDSTTVEIVKKKKETQPVDPSSAFSEPITIHGHREGVISLALSRTGASFLSTSPDKRVVLHSLTGGKPNVVYKHKSEGVAVVLCNNEKEAVFCDGGEVVVYDMVKKKVQSTFFNPSGGIEGMAALPDGSFVLLAANDGCVRWWNVAAKNFEHTFTLDKKSALTGVTVDEKGAVAAFGFADGRVAIWDLTTRREIKRWKAHNGRITALAVSPNGRRFATCGEDNLTLIWDVRSGTQLQKLAGHKGSGIFAVAWFADGRRIVTGGTDQRVFQWDAESGVKSAWAPAADDAVLSLTVDAKSRFVLVGEKGGIIQLLPLPRTDLEVLPPPRQKVGG